MNKPVRIITPAKKLTACLSRDGLEMKDLAARLKVTPSALSKVLKGVSRSQKIEKAVTEIIGEDIFPVNIQIP